MRRSLVRRPWSRKAAALLILFMGPLLPERADAQSSLQIPLQFDFINPGAKSKAMGGAFVGLADDATATFANPAGLTLISRLEVSFEGRHARIESPFLERGRISGTIINEGTDTIQGPAFGTSVGSNGALGFASFVYPHPSQRWSVAGYRHVLTRVDQSFETNGVFQKMPEEFTSRREFPLDAVRRVNVTGYGATAGYRLAPEVSVGVGLTVYDFSIDSTFLRYDTVDFLGPPNKSVELGRSLQYGDDLSIAPTVGAIVGLTGRFRLGAMYRHGPSFTFRTKDGNDPERSNTFRLPHTLAVGASFRPATTLTVAAEVTRISYGRLTNDFVTYLSRLIGREQDFTIDSGTEVHLGAQYLPTISYGAPKFRAGIWYDPDHSVRFEPTRPASTIIDRAFDERMSVALSPGEGLIHYTGGIGFSLSPRVEANAAFDMTSRSRVISASMVVR